MELDKATDWGSALKDSIPELKLSTVFGSKTTLDSCDLGSYGNNKHPSGYIEGAGVIFPFFPESAQKNLKIESQKNGIEISHISEDAGITSLLFVIVQDDKLNFFSDFYPYNFYISHGDWNKPVWDYRHPELMNQLSILLKPWYQKKLMKFLSPYPLYERYSKGDQNLYMPRGIFYPTHKMRSLSFRGTGEVKYISLANYTNEPVTYRWFVPNSWKDKIGWVSGKKLTHKLKISPNSEVRSNNFSVFIDPSITEAKTFIQTLLVAQGPNRIEWLPIPLFPEREEGNFFIEPKDVNPPLE